jgi:hypothetical protein
VAGALVLAASVAACGSGHSVPQRPVWDGYGTPPAPAGVVMGCPAYDAGNAARLADGALVECVIDGRGFAWEAWDGVRS